MCLDKTLNNRYTGNMANHNNTDALSQSFNKSTSLQITRKLTMEAELHRCSHSSFCTFCCVHFCVSKCLDSRVRSPVLRRRRSKSKGTGTILTVLYHHLYHFVTVLYHLFSDILASAVLATLTPSPSALALL